MSETSEESTPNKSVPIGRVARPAKATKRKTKKAARSKSAAKPTATKPSPKPSPPVRVERVLELLDKEIEEQETEFERQKEHLAALYEAANRIAKSAGLEEPYVD